MNIDFEFVKSGSREHFKTFIHDLRQAFHDQIPGSEVSIAMPSVDWWGSYDYDYLSDNSDGLMIMAYGYYYSGSSRAGPLSPLRDGRSSWHITRTIEDYLTKTGQDGSQLILGLPWYGIDWPVTSTAIQADVITDRRGSSIFYYNAEPQALSNDKQYDSVTETAWYNYNDGEMHQVWYDDSLSLSKKYNFAKTKGIKGIGIWALGYDGGRAEMWGALRDAFGATAPPVVSPYFTVTIQGSAVRVKVAPSTHTDSYEVHTSSDGVAFALADSSPTPEMILDNLPNDQITYMKIRNTNDFGSSGFSEVLAVAPGSSPARVLIVQGFDRSSGTTNNFDYIIQHAEAIHANSYGLESASNEAIESGEIDLNEYDIVDWISGEESTINESLSTLEQDRIKLYLEGGGRFFISGSEIGWDLVARGDASDIAFYQDYLKSLYMVDDAGSYTMDGSSIGIFTGLSAITFDDGSHGTYDVDYPDGIKPVAGAVSNMTYAGANYSTQGGAGVQYRGTFGTSHATGSLVHLAVGLEAIYPEGSRTAVMGRVLDFFQETVHIGEDVITPSSFTVSAAYPNPFNGSVRIDIHSDKSMRIDLKIYNMAGQLIDHLDQELQTGENSVVLTTFARRSLSSGLYLLQVNGENHSQTQRITYVK